MHTWAELATVFHFVSAAAFTNADRFERYQAWRERVTWFGPEHPPLAVLFLSHRWESRDDPDPTRRQFNAARRFLDLIARWTCACMAPAAERAHLMPALDTEGSLQAYTIAARMLGLEPMEPAFAEPAARRAEIEAARAKHGSDSSTFAAWLAGRIAVWIDYSCVPQPQRTSAETTEFRTTLRRLPELMRATTLVALRYAGDNYASSGWCAIESFVASRGPDGRGFARNVFVDVDALLEGRPLYVSDKLLAPARPGSEEAAVLDEGHRLGLQAFEAARTRLLDDPVALSKSSPPRLWSEYLALLSDSFHPADIDPNPVRHALELVLFLGEAIVQRWLFAENAVEIDLRELVEATFDRAKLVCSASEDCMYLALVVLSRAKPRVFQPMARDALAAWVARMSSARTTDPLHVRLHPLPASSRALLRSLSPSSAGVWHSRLSSGGTAPEERAVVDALIRSFDETPPVYEIVDQTE